MRGGAPASAVAKRERRGGLFRPVPTAGLGDFIQVHGAADFIQRPVDVGAVEESRQDVLPVAQKRRRGEQPVGRAWDDALALGRAGGPPVGAIPVGEFRPRPVDGDRPPYDVELYLDLSSR